MELDPKIPHCVFQLGMAKKQLAGSEIAGLLVEDRYLGAAKAVRAILGRFQPDKSDPGLHEAEVLPSGQAGTLHQPAWEQSTVWISTPDSQPLCE